jgi:hypothetical protein
MQLSHGSLETIKEEHFADFSIREILFKSERFGDSTVYQLHYSEWPGINLVVRVDANLYSRSWLSGYRIAHSEIRGNNG